MRSLRDREEGLRLGARIAARRGTTIEALRGRSRKARIAAARRAWWRALLERGMSVRLVSRLAQRDRSTVSFVVRHESRWTPR